MFEIIGAIDNCPPYILSAHRTLVSKAEVQQVEDGRILKCDTIQMFLFNDSMEFAKRRNRGNLNQTSTKSPALIQRGGQMKPYKHIDFIKLSMLKNVIDVKDEGEHKDLFALVHYPSVASQQCQLKVYKLLPGTDKQQWLHTIIKCLSETKCTTADTENYLVLADAWEVIENKNDTSQNKEKTGYLGKIIGKTKAGLGKRIARAMTSASKTPKIQHQTNTTLRRAVSITTTPASTPSGDTQVDTPMTPCTPLSSSALHEISLMDVSVCDETKKLHK